MRVITCSSILFIFMLALTLVPGNRDDENQEGIAEIADQQLQLAMKQRADSDTPSSSAHKIRHRQKRQNPGIKCIKTLENSKEEKKGPCSEEVDTLRKWATDPDRKEYLTKLLDQCNAKEPKDVVYDVCIKLVYNDDKGTPQKGCGCSQYAKKIDALNKCHQENGPRSSKDFDKNATEKPTPAHLICSCSDKDYCNTATSTRPSHTLFLTTSFFLMTRGALQLFQ